MNQKNNLKTIMTNTLSDKNIYLPTNNEIENLFNLINQSIFQNTLPSTDIIIKRSRGYYGWCKGDINSDNQFYTQHIRLINKYENIQQCVATLTHEMIHHWQWSIYSNQRLEKGLPPSKAAIMSHGPSFYQWKPILNKYKIPLYASQ